MSSALAGLVAVLLMKSEESTQSELNKFAGTFKRSSTVLALHPRISRTSLHKVRGNAMRRKKR